jgi:hypothetical protein
MEEEKVRRKGDSHQIWEICADLSRKLIPSYLDLVAVTFSCPNLTSSPAPPFV